jgi:hypothetical protein
MSKKKQTAETTVEEAPVAKKAPVNNIGKVARAAIMAGKTNQEALDEVMATFPGAKTSLNSINWYRNDLRAKGEAVPKIARAKKEKTAADPLIG